MCDDWLGVTEACIHLSTTYFQTLLQWFTHVPASFKIRYVITPHISAIIWLRVDVHWLFLLFESQSVLPAGIACSSQTPADEFLLYSHTDQHSRHWMGGLSDTDLFLYMYSLRWRCLSPLFLWVLSVFVSLWMRSSSLPAYPTLSHPLSPSPFPFLCLSWTCSLMSWHSLHLVKLKADKYSTCLLKAVCVWFVCRLRTETGNSKRSWSWLSRSCSRPSAKQRLCPRWKQS